MTLRQPNIDRMLQLGFTGMAEALEEQADIANIDQLGFDDRLAMMLERETPRPEELSWPFAPGCVSAPMSRTSTAGRGIARTTLTQLATGDWIRQSLNLIVNGPTGAGKTFVACALAHQACRQKRSVLYRRVPELVTALTRDKGTHERLMKRLAGVDLLLLDDWGLQGFSAEGHLLEIVEARHARKSILIASQIPALAQDHRRSHHRRCRPRPHRSQRLSHRSHRRVAAKAQQAPRRRNRQVREPGGRVHGRLWRLPARNTKQAHLPAQWKGRAGALNTALHHKQGSLTLVSGWPPASPLKPLIKTNTQTHRRD